MEAFHDSDKIELQIKNMLEEVLKDENTNELNISQFTLESSNFENIERSEQKFFSQKLSLDKQFQPKIMRDSRKVYTDKPVNNLQLKTAKSNQVTYFDFNNTLNLMDSSTNSPLFSNENLNISTIENSKRQNFVRNYPKTTSQQSGLNRNSNSSTICSFSNSQISDIPLLTHFSNSFSLEELIVKFLIHANTIEEEAYFNLQGKFFLILKNQNGSRRLQELIPFINQEILGKILIEIELNLPELMCDLYANYFCQKLFFSLEEKMKIHFLFNIKDFLGIISRNKVGTYALQTIIQGLNTNEQKLVIGNGINLIDFYEMCLDRYGIHVVEKIIIAFDEHLIPNVYSFLISNFMSLALHCNGIGVVKRIISNLKFQSSLLKIQFLIFKHFNTLIFDIYGNYVIQVAIEFWREPFVTPILDCFKGKFYELSMNKFSSNVVEKCIEFGGQEILDSFVSEVILENRIIDLIKNCFGNFVVQKTLKLLNKYNLFRLTSVIKHNLYKLVERKLIMKWELMIKSAEDRFCNVSYENPLVVRNEDWGHKKN